MRWMFDFAFLFLVLLHFDFIYTLHDFMPWQVSTWVHTRASLSLDSFEVVLTGKVKQILMNKFLRTSGDVCVRQLLMHMLPHRGLAKL
jgi:hypothetical protein